MDWMLSAAIRPENPLKAELSYMWVKSLRLTPILAIRSSKERGSSSSIITVHSVDRAAASLTLAAATAK